MHDQTGVGPFTSPPHGGGPPPGPTPYAAGPTPYAAGSMPYATGSMPYAAGSMPYAAGAMPYAAGAMPYAAGYAPNPVRILFHHHLATPKFDTTNYSIFLKTSGGSPFTLAMAALVMVQRIHQLPHQANQAQRMHPPLCQAMLDLELALMHHLALEVPQPLFLVLLLLHKQLRHSMGFSLRVELSNHSMGILSLPMI